MRTLMINAMVLIVAGSDTSATLLSGLLYLLLKNPTCLQKITHEIRSAFKSEDEITFSSVQNLPYSMSYQASPLCPRLVRSTGSLTREPPQCSPASKRPFDAIRLYQAPCPASCPRAVRTSPAISCQRGPS